MDIRGVEITNQLRSAIRAKLLELGVRYDEELPDYILVMVVNKKSRQQMSEDLNLFLEDSTESFVTWLHDQVLKKLQKVTVAKKKTLIKDPMIVVKKEEDEKKPKVEKESDTPPLKPPEATSKQDRDREFEELVGDLALLNEDDPKLSSKETIDEGKPSKKRSSGHSSDFESRDSNSEKRNNFTSDSSESKPAKTRKKSSSPKSLHPSESREYDEYPDPKRLSLDSTDLSAKQPFGHTESLNEKEIVRSKHSKGIKDSENKDDRPKSNTSKPKITSVVSVKSRLGASSPSKKTESFTKINDLGGNSKSHLDARRRETEGRSSSHQSKSLDSRKRSHESKNERSRESRNHAGHNVRSEKSSKPEHSRDLLGRPSSKKSTIKSRLGIISPKKDGSSVASSSTKASQPKTSNVKSRLGIKVKDDDDDELLSLRRLPELGLDTQHFEDEDGDSVESEFTSSLRSHIIAVKKLKAQKARKKSSKESRKTESEEDILQETEDDEDDDLTKVPSKVIVTPRPLKPLQPFQKRATQSLLLRAVAEANQSVVMQKKVDPCLKERKKKSRGKVKVTRDAKKGKVVSLNLKSKKKRSAIEKIKVELSNSKNVSSSKAHSSKRVSDEHLSLVKSLFQRSDDKQKFLVTLNGYNNNVSVEKNSDEEDQEEVEVIEEYDEDDDLDLENNQYEFDSESEQILDEAEYMYDDEDDEENCEMVQQETIPLCIQSHQLPKRKFESEDDGDEESNHPENSERKRGRISPIVYARSRSNSPTSKPTLSSSTSSLLSLDKRPVMNSVISTLPDKSSEKCRYWPNCTLGMKCAYYHPEVPCSSFPACKFGEKCAYQHPKCKFGSACTKLGCIFSHPPVQCKYHPYCMKPGCQYSHPKIPGPSLTSSLTSIPPLPPDPSILRAKFVWKKKD